LVREVRNRIPGIKVIVHTSSTDHQLEVWFAGNPDVSLLHKDEGDRALLRAVNAALDPGYHNWKAFIVHGRDRTSVLELKSFLRDRLGFPEPMVLSEMPSIGMTLIEKFERYAAEADVVFVLITPDDLGQLAGDSGVSAFRASRSGISWAYYAVRAGEYSSCIKETLKFPLT
jgi:predicted nucleotide-binding protein